jgi:hypothetical protein
MRSLMMSVQNLILFTGYGYGGERIACNMCGSHGTVTICRHDRRLKCLHWVACYDCGHIRNDPNIDATTNGRSPTALPGSISSAVPVRPRRGTRSSHQF